ncbi:hypothetical protein KAR91_32610 [Candidatus Pacearchaeota archaeon]|nr:hypothetical protein [Candidatus Pacearchaeota archaeon]
MIRSLLIILSLCLFIGCGDKGPGHKGDKDIDLTIQKIIDECKVTKNSISTLDSLPKNRSVINSNRMSWTQVGNVTVPAHTKDVGGPVVLSENIGYASMGFYDYASNACVWKECLDGNGLVTWASSVDNDGSPEYFYGGGTDVTIANVYQFPFYDPNNWHLFDFDLREQTFDGEAMNINSIIFINHKGIFDFRGDLWPAYFDPYSTRLTGGGPAMLIAWGNPNHTVVVIRDGFHVGIGTKYTPWGGYDGVGDLAYDQVRKKLYLVLARPGHHWGGNLFWTKMNDVRDRLNSWNYLPGLLTRISVDQSNGQLFGMNAEGKIFTGNPN